MKNYISRNKGSTERKTKYKHKSKKSKWSKWLFVALFILFVCFCFLIFLLLFFLAGGEKVVKCVAFLSVMNINSLDTQRMEIT